MPRIPRPIFDWSDDEDARRAAASRDVDDHDADDEADAAADAQRALDDADDVYAALPDDDAQLDDAFPLGDGLADSSATVWCPYCGEPSEVAVDPGGGAAQEYVEDCPVCCRPWRVTVAYQADGSASVWAHTDDE